jgi:uncharacterized heparinase superfamily protein
MTALTIGERRRLMQLLIGRARRSAVSRVLHSPLMRWQFGAPVADEILMLPQELRTADASFADEIAHGMFGLGGTVATLGRESVFNISPPTSAWARSLHGFGWLRHLTAANTPTAKTFAVDSVQDWISRFARRTGPPWTADVVGRRIFSWLSNAELLLQGADSAFYDRFADSLGTQMIHLAACRHDVADGLPRLVALNGLLAGAICIAGHDNLLARMELELAAELDRQLHDDGGHVSRNPTAVVELLMDLLPLQTCFNARERDLPEGIADAIPRMLRFLQFMRLGDGSLAHFNGTGAAPFDALATLVAYVADDETPLSAAPASAYARLERGDVIAIIDGGGPPRLEHAATACASSLAFEMSSGTFQILVNGGAPGPADQDWLSRSRATASHNTLVLGSKSSSKIIRNGLLSYLTGGAPIRMPAKASFSVAGDNDAIAFEGEHDGYSERFGLLHKRRLRLDKEGHWLEGRDQIVTPAREKQPPQDVPFAVHFHLHPDNHCESNHAPEIVRIILPDGATWEMTTADATVSIEDSIYFADRVGPTKTRQIVFRGSCFGDKTINWRLARVN